MNLFFNKLEHSETYAVDVLEMDTRTQVSSTFSRSIMWVTLG
jgi:hypothetical protein